MIAFFLKSIDKTVLLNQKRMTNVNVTT